MQYTYIQICRLIKVGRGQVWLAWWVMKLLKTPSIIDSVFCVNGRFVVSQEHTSYPTLSIGQKTSLGQSTPYVISLFFNLLQLQDNWGIIVCHGILCCHHWGVVFQTNITLQDPGTNLVPRFHDFLLVAREAPPQAQIQHYIQANNIFFFSSIDLNIFFLPFKSVSLPTFFPPESEALLPSFDLCKCHSLQGIRKFPPRMFYL